jgi:hypothetical protein
LQKEKKRENKFFNQPYSTKFKKAEPIDPAFL